LLSQTKTLGDDVHLIADRLQFVAGDCESQRVKRVRIDLKVIDSAVHASTSSDVFIRENGAAQPSFKLNSFTLTANHLTSQTLQLPFFLMTK
jgi:hypothetical protein